MQSLSSESLPISIQVSCRRNIVLHIGTAKIWNVVVWRSLRLDDKSSEGLTEFWLDLTEKVWGNKYVKLWKISKTINERDKHLLFCKLFILSWFSHFNWIFVASNTASKLENLSNILSLKCVSRSSKKTLKQNFKLKMFFN
jgi:hypothetical protein